MTDTPQDETKRAWTARLVGALEDCLPYVREASEHQGYGFFCGGDPRDFFPDRESCTEEEIANHKLACEAYEVNAAPLPNPSEWLLSEDGKRVAHLLKAPFGIGSYVIRDRDATDLIERVRALLARARGEQ